MLIFRWTVSSEKDCDIASYSKDGAVVKSISGKSNPWMSETNHVSDAATHIWTFTYSKDAANKSGSDSLTIANLKWIPFVEPAEPIPDIGDSPSVAEIQTALNGSEDEKLAANITTAVEYTAYRIWANKVKKSDGTGLAGQQAVKDAPNAWLSYALGSETLIETRPVNGDMKVDAFEPTSMRGEFDFTVRIDKITVGVDAKPNNLAKVFGVEGGTSLEAGGLSSENVSITFWTPENGKVRFTAGPKDVNSGAFFMRVKMYP